MSPQLSIAVVLCLAGLAIIPTLSHQQDDSGFETDGRATNAHSGFSVESPESVEDVAKIDAPERVCSMSNDNCLRGEHCNGDIMDASSVCKPNKNCSLEKPCMAENEFCEIVRDKHDPHNHNGICIPFKKLPPSEKRPCLNGCPDGYECGDELDQQGDELLCQLCNRPEGFCVKFPLDK